MSETININIEPGTPEELKQALIVIFGLTLVVFIVLGLFIWGWVSFHGVEWTNTDSLRSSSCAYGVMKC